MTISSTASAAKAILSLALCSAPATASDLTELVRNPPRPILKKSSTTLPPVIGGGVGSVQLATVAANIQSITMRPQGGRATTEVEKVVGDIREWSLLAADWDGEGALIPNARSLRDASLFVRLLGSGSPTPEPMLHADGNAGLFWNTAGIYADIEFLDGGRIAYFVERRGDKHKGVLSFDSKTLPAVLQTLLVV